MKELRDTFASQLLTAGIQLGYVSHQLGHADVATTSRHYAKWCGGAEYREAITPEDGELPADLLARIVEESPQSPHTTDVAETAFDGDLSDLAHLHGSGEWTRTTDLRLMKKSRGPGRRR
jgi:hypothetical protein